MPQTAVFSTRPSAKFLPLIALEQLTTSPVTGQKASRKSHYHFPKNNGITDIERQAKLAFALFLIGVGIPGICAGKEFCDRMNRPVGGKETGPGNKEHQAQDRRPRIFNCVAGRVSLRFKNGAPLLEKTIRSSSVGIVRRGLSTMVWLGSGVWRFRFLLRNFLLLRIDGRPEQEKKRLEGGSAEVVTLANSDGKILFEHLWLRLA